MRLFPIFSALLISLPLAAETKIEVGINGRPAAEDSGKNIPHDAFETLFTVDPPPGLIRYRLAGYDADWTERSGDMFFRVSFLNANGDQIAQVPYAMKGVSKGWSGTEETSIPSDRRERITVPPDARNVVVAISSAGPATAVGTLSITNLRVIARGATIREMIGSAAPAVWEKGGTRPSMASSREADDGAAVHVIIDDDITGHADWKTVANAATRVTPGETLDIAWQESFCTGMGDVFTVKYGGLPAGAYRFEVDALGFSGEPPGERAVLPIRVAPPYWKNPWYWAAFALITVVVSSLIARHFIRKSIERHLREARMIADERLRIARDLHDDLGARLSHISLLGSHAMNTAPDPETQRTFGEITSMSRELVTSLSETVWMLNSKNDRLESLVDYLCRMVSGLCRSLDIRCRIDAISPPEDQAISGELRHHVTMSVKEAVNNALKHSGCTEIRLKIALDGEVLEITVTDNGIGLGTVTERGNGLENIRQRMSQLGGSVRIEKPEDGGVVVRLQIPLNAPAS